jgi:hypothetical protein
MRRLGVIVALGTMLGMFGGVLTASPALAGRGPKWQVFPAVPRVLDASVCGFPVQTTPVGKEYFKVLKSTSGFDIVLITGSFRESYTNLITGKTITENGPGSAKFTFNADGSGSVVIRGRAAVMFSADEAQRFGVPRVGITTGKLTILSDQNNTTTSISLNGKVAVDVCAALS